MKKENTELLNKTKGQTKIIDEKMEEMSKLKEEIDEHHHKEEDHQCKFKQQQIEIDDLKVDLKEALGVNLEEKDNDK